MSDDSATTSQSQQHRNVAESMTDGTWSVPATIRAMILEGIVTSLNAAGELNVAPMGPIVDESLTWLHLRPFKTSQTYQNLDTNPFGVFHVVDDVLLLAKAAIGKLDTAPETFAAEKVSARVLTSACRWYEFEVEWIDATRDRTDIRGRVVHVGRLRDFFGFNRAKHAVLEAAILATRLHLLPRDEIERQLAALRSPVEKTAGPNELAAFQLVCDHVANVFSLTPDP